MIDADLRALDRLVNENLVYQHGTGARQGKAEYLGLISTGGYRYTEITSEDEEIYVYGDVAVIVTSLHFKLIGESGAFQAHRRATLIWVRRESEWRLEVYQGCILPYEDERARQAAFEPTEVQKTIFGTRD